MTDHFPVPTPMHPNTVSTTEINADDPAVSVLLDTVPEFHSFYCSLAAECDDEPGSPIVFTELADFVAESLRKIESARPVLTRTFEAIEIVCSQGKAGTELVSWAFFDSLPPREREVITPWLGPVTRAVLDDLNNVDGVDDPDLASERLVE